MEGMGGMGGKMEKPVMRKPNALLRIIRYLLAAGLVVGSYYEAGPYTSGAFGLIFVMTECQGWFNRTVGNVLKNHTFCLQLCVDRLSKKDRDCEEDSWKSMSKH